MKRKRYLLDISSNKLLEILNEPDNKYRGLDYCNTQVLWYKQKYYIGQLSLKHKGGLPYYLLESPDKLISGPFNTRIEANSKLQEISKELQKCRHLS